MVLKMVSIVEFLLFIDCVKNCKVISMGVSVVRRVYKWVFIECDYYPEWSRYCKTPTSGPCKCPLSDKQCKFWFNGILRSTEGPLPYGTSS